MSTNLVIQNKLTQFQVCRIFKIYSVNKSHFYIKHYIVKLWLSGDQPKQIDRLPIFLSQTKIFNNSISKSAQISLSKFETLAFLVEIKSISELRVLGFFYTIMCVSKRLRIKCIAQSIRKRLFIQFSGISNCIFRLFLATFV